MTGKTERSLEAILLGSPKTVSLECRVSAAIALIFCVMSAVTVFSNAFLFSLEEMYMALLCMFISGGCYLFIRRTNKWRTLPLPACILFLGVLGADWVLDPGAPFSSDGFYFVLLIIVSGIVLRQKQKTPFVILVCIVITGIFARMALHPALRELDKRVYLYRLLDNGLTLIMSAIAMTVIVRLVIKEYRRVSVEARAAAEEIKTLRGLLPICSRCKKVRDDDGGWNMIEKYVEQHSEAEFTHSLCPDCLKDTYGELQLKLPLSPKPKEVPSPHPHRG